MRQLWQDLQDIAYSMNEAWCVLAYFNLVLSKEDRIGGNETREHEVKDFASCIEICDLHEMRSIGAFYLWTNKTI